VHWQSPRNRSLKIINVFCSFEFADITKTGDKKKPEHIIRCLKNKKCENENENDLDTVPIARIIDSY